MFHRLLSFLSAIKPTRLGVLFAVLVGVGVGFWQWGRPPRPRVVLEKVGQRIVLQPFFSPDGQGLVAFHRCDPSNSDFLNLTLWDARNGRKKFDYSQFDSKMLNPLDGIVFSPDGRTMACLFWEHSGILWIPAERRIRVWDVPSGKELQSVKEKDGTAHLVFSTEGKLLIRRGSVLWDLADNKVAKELLGNGEKIIRWRANLVLVRSQDDVLKVWDLARGDVLKVWDLAGGALAAEQRDILSICSDEKHTWEWISDRFFLSPNGLGGGTIFDLETGQSTQLTLTGSLDITPDGRTMAVEDRIIELPKTSWYGRLIEWFGTREGSLDDGVVLKDFYSGLDIVALKGCKSPHFSPDGKTLVVEGNDGSLQLWDLPIRKPIGRILGLAGLAAVATLLALGGLGWLRRRRMRLKADAVPNSVPAAQ